MAHPERHRVLLLVLVVVRPSELGAQLTDARTPDPWRAAFVYDDLDHFIAAMEKLASAGDTVAVLETDYFGRASPGLRMFVEKYELTAERLAAAIAAHPEAYSGVREIRDALARQEPEFRQAYAELKRFAPVTEFPPTYFLIGAYRGIGSGSIEGPLITVEKETPEGIQRDLATTLVHEMVHLQQLMLQGEEYFAIFGPKKTLLALTIREGTADFFAERVTGIVSEHNEGARAYVREHEDELWMSSRRSCWAKRPVTGCGKHPPIPLDRRISDTLSAPGSWRSTTTAPPTRAPR